MRFRVTDDIPYGNVCGASVRRESGRHVVAFTAHPHGGPEALWFCFRIEAPAAAEPRPDELDLRLKHLGNLLGANDPGAIRPVVRYAGGDWERLGPGRAVELPDGRIEAHWTLPAPERSVDVACCYPYGRPDVDALVRETGGVWQADTIGVSQAGRPLLRLSNGPGAPDSARPGLYLIARQHSGETPGSWVLDGFLRHVATVGDAAPLVWAVPLANVDGVEEGDYGKDNFPWDLNRAWGRPAMRHEVHVLQRDLRRWGARCRPVLGMDFHAPGLCETEGVYAFVPDAEREPQPAAAIAPWAEVLAEALAPAYAAGDFARVARYASRWDAPHFRHYCWDAFEIPGIGLETPYAAAGDTLLTRERYREIGARLAAGIVERLTSEEAAE